MLILLPPSEGKADAESGKPVELDRLAFPDELTEPRNELLDELAGLAAIDRDLAVEALGITPGQAGEVDRDIALRSAPAGPALEVYTGVLYDRLDYPGLSKRAKEAADRSLLVASALWGVVRPGDRIPNYRLPAKAKLPGKGGLAAFWRPHLAAALEGSGFDRPGETVLDMRSGAYSAAWKPKQASLVPVRAFTSVNGTRKAVSHMAKATRGRVTRLVLSAKELPGDAEAVAHLLEGEGLEVELSADGLDVIEEG